MLAAIVLLSLTLAGASIALLRVRSRLATAADEFARRERLAESRFAGVESERAALRAILDGLGEGLLALDRQRRVVLANRRFAEMFGISANTVGRPLGEAIRVAAVFTAIDAAMRGSEATERFPSPSGASERRIEMRAIPVPFEQIAAVALFIDVTQLERLEQIRRDFISDFSHEVRTPLAGLASAVESYALGHMSAEEDQHLRRIMTRQLRRLQRLVDDIAELSRIEAGDLTLEQRDVDLRSILEELCEEFGERAAQKRLRFAIAGDAVGVRGDPLRIQQAFSNLLDNAIKYGGEDSTIDIALAASDGSVSVRIADHGEGIAPEERERIFRRLYRVDRSRSQDVAGSGLGLAIAKHLVLLHHGSIDVESEAGRGATFIVRLPARYTTRPDGP